MANHCKFFKEQKYISYDSGVTWSATSEYRQGALIESQSSDCSFTPWKIYATYTDGHSESAECNAASTVLNCEISYGDLTDIVIGNCVTSVTSLDGMFAYSNTLSSVTLLDSVTTVANQVFKDASNLKSVTFGNGLTTIGLQAFAQCTSLSSLTIPSGVTSIGNWAFYQCSGLTSITVNATTPPTLGNGAFNATNNCSIYVPCESVDEYKTAWSTYASRITCVAEPQYRTLTTATTCVGVDKHVLEEYQVSYDSGTTWTTTATSATTLIEADSLDCGYVPPAVSGDYLTFVIQTNGTFSLLNEYDENIEIEYSKNGGAWTSEYVNSDISVRSGDVVKLRGNITPQQITSRLQGGIGTFTSTCEFAASGNPMSLIVGDNFSGVTSLASYPFAFAYLFHSCSGLTDINGIQLPFETLSDNCYRAMFTSVGITALTANILSAATALTSNCYFNMFVECHSLESVPSGLLPATELAYNCYNAMFFYCDSLQIAPTLPATTLAERCYMNMFFDCFNLNYVECHATDISASNCTYNWLLDAGYDGTFKTPSTTNWSSGDSGIPNGWTRVDL